MSMLTVSVVSLFVGVIEKWPRDRLVSALATLRSESGTTKRERANVGHL
jgi:hypothetical protein